MPPFATIALFDTSLANLAITVPFADGLTMPFIVKVLLPVEALVALLAAGKSYAAEPRIVVCDVVVSE